MNIFQEAKAVLDKDGKVNPLGPYGKQKLTGREISTYFRRNKITDPEIKKAVEVALDLGGAFDIAGKEIQKFYGRAVRNSKEVKNALVYANESYQAEQVLETTITEGKNLMPAIQKIVDDKGAAKVGGVMLDMFTASMITTVYDKVNDQNKKKMEGSNIQTLVHIAHKVMGMKESIELEEKKDSPKEFEKKVVHTMSIMKKYPANKNKSDAVLRKGAIKYLTQKPRGASDDYSESLDEEMISYRVKGMQRPEEEKFKKSAKMMGLKITMDKGKKDTVIVMSGTKKKLRDFDAVARGKSSYGDPSTITHFDEK